MNQYNCKQEFDQQSSASFKSHISNMRFNSPLPLPKNSLRIPSNDQISNAYEEIEKIFPQVEMDQMFTILYNNQEAKSVNSKQSKSEHRSQYSNISEVTAIKPGQVKFKVHPIIKSNQGSQKIQQSIRNRVEKQFSSKKKKHSDDMTHHKGENEQNLRKAQQWKSEENKEYQLFSKDVARQFNTKQDKVIYQQKRLIAKAYCQKGFGIDKLKQMVWENQGRVIQIDKKKYKVICMTAVCDGYRKLEIFLAEDCKRNIKPLTGPEMRALQSVLLNAGAKLQEEEYLTLRKFIKVAFDLGSVSIFEQLAIQICLRGRVGAMKLDKLIGGEFRHKRDMLKSPGRYQNQRLESQTIWTAELEVELIDTVIENKTIAKSRDVMRLKYGQNVVLNNVRELKARFFKIIRLAAKRLIRYASQFAHEVPLLVNLCDDKIKTVIRHPAALQSRLALGRLYKSKKVNSQLLTDVINVVNQFCYLEQTRRETQQRLKQPIINTVTDKIKHNISVSKKLLKNVTTPAQRAGVEGNLIFLKQSEASYQHIVSLQHNDKLHYFRKRGVPNSKGGFQYTEKPPQLKKLQLEDGDDDSEQLVMFSDDDYQSSQGVES